MKPKLRRQMPPQRANTIEHLSALLLVHQRNQLKSDLQRQLIHLQQRREILSLRRIGCLRLITSQIAVLRQSGCKRLLLACGQLPRNQRHPSRHQNKRQLWQAWNQSQRHSTPHAIQSVLRPRSSCVPSSWSSDPADEARVSTMPPAIDTSRLGIIVTRPSPTVRIV